MFFLVIVVKPKIVVDNQIIFNEIKPITLIIPPVAKKAMWNPQRPLIKTELI